MSEQLAEYQPQTVPQTIELADYAMSVNSMLRQVKVIQDTLNTVMKEGEHYGKIPGCGPKPTLLKPGAEKISATFHLAPSYEIVTTDFVNGHREYQVTCTLKHTITGFEVGQGVGSCSTMESKYRFRTRDIDTGLPIPKDYRDNKGAYREQGYKATKIGDKWAWVKSERTEHDNPADYYNTCLKMAKKRAHVDAVLTATAASDIFTQDIEELKDNGVIEGVIVETHTDTTKVGEDPKRTLEGQVTEPQINKILAMLNGKGHKSNEEKHQIAASMLGKEVEGFSFKSLTKAEASKLIEDMTKAA